MRRSPSGLGRIRRSSPRRGGSRRQGFPGRLRASRFLGPCFREALLGGIGGRSQVGRVDLEQLPVGRPLKRHDVGKLLDRHSRHGLLHELEPDREGCARTGFLIAERDALVIVAHPHARRDLWCKADVPGIGEVIGRAGLPPEGRPSSLARTPVPNCTTSSSMATIVRATSGGTTSVTFGRGSSRTAPS